MATPDSTRPTRLQTPEQDLTQAHVSTSLNPETSRTEHSPGGTTGTFGGGVLEAEVALPQRIGRYEILDEIARGGMGVVYRAQDIDLSRNIALKLVQARFSADQPTLRRFIDEARITGRLQHPGIPPVHEFGQLADGRPFLAMKLIRGQTLAAKVLESPGTADRCLLIAAFEQICQAVGYAHSQGVIHRDLKPQNVMVGAFGEVQVMDWGLAKDLNLQPGDEFPRGESSEPLAIPDRQSDVTQAGTIMGTPAYMAPEQARGEIELLDARADVFGLGAILCEILTGGPPFVGTRTFGALYLASTGNVGDAFARLDACGTDPEMIALAKKCLDPDHDQRFENGGAVAMAIAAWRSAADERAHKAEVERAAADATVASERKRRRIQFALALAVLVIVVGTSGVLWWAQKQRIAGAQADAERVRLEAEQQRQEQARKEQDLRVRDGVRQTLDALPDLYSRWLWAQAEAALNRAEALIGPDGDPALRAEVEAARRNTRFGQHLDTVRLRAMASRDGDIDESIEAINRSFRSIFQEFGLDILKGSIDDLGRQIAKSPIRELLIECLDDWSTKDGTAFERLWQITAVATNQPWRAEIAAIIRDHSLEKANEVFNRIPDKELTPAISRNHSSLTREPKALRDRLEKGLLRFPHDFWARLALGKVYSDLKEYDSAIGEYRACLAIRPDSGVPYSQMSSIYSRKGDYERAIETGRIGVRTRPSAYAYLGLAFALMDNHELPEAIAAAKDAIRLDPTYPLAHRVLGVMYFQSRKYPEAVAAMREAVRLDPEDPYNHHGLGDTLRAAGDLPGAVAALKEAVRLKPKFASFHNALGLALRQSGDLEGAAKTYETTVKLDPKAGPVHANLGYVYRLLGRFAESKEAYQKALDLLPQNGMLKQQLKTSEQYIALDKRLKELTRDKDSEIDDVEKLQLARFAAQPFVTKYDTALRYYQQLFASDPALIPKHRFAAGVVAIQRAAGNDKNAAIGLDEWHELHRLAQGWMRADLDPLLTLSGTSVEAVREVARLILLDWIKLPGLSSVRDAAQRALMPDAATRAGWEQIWAAIQQSQATTTP